MRTRTKKTVEGLETQDQVGEKYPWLFVTAGDDGYYAKDAIEEAAKEYGVSEEFIRAIVEGVAERTHEFAKSVVADLSALWLRMDELENRIIAEVEKG